MKVPQDVTISSIRATLIGPLLIRVLLKERMSLAEPSYRFQTHEPYEEIRRRSWHVRVKPRR